MIQRDAAAATLRGVRALGLVSQREVDTVLGVFEPCFAFVDALRAADSIHVHVKVDDVAQAPHQELCAGGGIVENSKPGYIKYGFPGGINIILSSIDVSEDDLAETSCARRPRPLVDHVGIDLRSEAPDVAACFDVVPKKAAKVAWPTVPQGGPGRPVYCCHIEVGRKHWVYPEGDEGGDGIPLEFALGELKVNAESSGCDLRPARPGTEASGASKSCAAGQKQEASR